jgi:hypothetical protein
MYQQTLQGTQKAPLGWPRLTVGATQVQTKQQMPHWHPVERQGGAAGAFGRTSEADVLNDLSRLLQGFDLHSSGEALLNALVGRWTGAELSKPPPQAVRPASPSSEIERLAPIAERGDADLFVRALSKINLGEKGPGFYLQVIRLALKAGAYMAARRLAAQGSERHGEDRELAKFAAVLAPPRALRRKPADPFVKANMDWLKRNRLSYHGKWVALRAGSLVAHGARLSDLVNQVGGKEALRGLLVTRVQ